MDAEEIRRAQAALQRISDQIDSGELEASDSLAAYIAGAAQALDIVHSETSPK